MAFEHLYRPQHKSDPEIVNDFVVRTTVFARLMADIRKDAPGKLSQHHIVQGLRGMGKSTLFERIRVEMKEPGLNERWLTVKTAEENWPVNSLLDFWIWIGQHMAAVDPAGFGALGDLGTLWNKDEEHEQCFTFIEARLKGSKKKLLMLVDNVGDLFRKFSEQENHAFREALVASKHIKLIGGSAVRLDELEMHNAPYFDLFKMHHLAGLNQQEVIALLQHYAKKNGNTRVEAVIQNEPHRVEHLRILAGGVPRTIMLLLDVFEKDGEATVFDDLRRTLDLVTPLYKHRMDELSAQKQKIVHALAMNWDGMSAGEVGSATRLESKVVSAQLGQLVREGSVLRDETSTKNHFYQLAERFFNIWYLMNNAQRNGAAKVRWLTRFFELWCDERGLKQRAQRHYDTLSQPSLDPHGQLLISNALLGSGRLDVGSKQQLYERTKQSYPEQADQILSEPHWGAKRSERSYRTEVWEVLERMELDKAEGLLRTYANDSDPMTWVLRGEVAMFTGNFPEAREFYEEGLRIGKQRAEADPGNAQAQRDLSVSYNKLGGLLLREGKLPEVRTFFEEGLRISKQLAEVDLGNSQAQRDLSISHNKLGELLLREGNIPEARKSFEEDMRISKQLVEADLGNAQAQRDLSVSHNKLGILLMSEGKLPEARKTFEEGLRMRKHLAKKDGSNAQVQRDLSISYELLGDLLGREGNPSEARASFERSLRMRQQLAEAEPRNAQAQQDLAWSHWQLSRTAAPDKAQAAIHREAYHRIVAGMAQLAISEWMKGDLEEAMSRTVQLAAWLPMSTAKTLEALLWGLARQQYHGFRELFEERFPHFKNEYRPVYFALLRLMKDEDPDSYRRMGKELEEPVQQILDRVAAMRKELGPGVTTEPPARDRKDPRKATNRKA